jgi:hypothetical protein
MQTDAATLNHQILKNDPDSCINKDPDSAVLDP